MSRFGDLSPELRAWLRVEASGSVIYIPRNEPDEAIEERRARIREAHRVNLGSGLTTRQSVRLLMLQEGLSRSQVFRHLENCRTL